MHTDNPLWWLLPPLVVVLLAICITTFVGRRRERHAAKDVMYSNYVESQKRRQQRLAGNGYFSSHESESVRVLHDHPAVGKPGRHRLGS